MHMADALLAPAVAATMYAASTVATSASIVNIRKENRYSIEPVSKNVPAMAVMSAMVFAGQMINYTIPGTGSSGHICGGMLLTTILGPWAAFLSMIIILTIQCLFFADGGLLALGANIWNMAFYGCFVGYFLIYRPIIKSKLFSGKGQEYADRAKLALAAILGCVVTLQLGAFSVALETTASGITELPIGAFVALMQPIHLAIGLVEGIATAAVLLFIYSARPEMLKDISTDNSVSGKMSLKATVIILAAVVLMTGGGFSLLASGNPDGLEWSLFGNEESGYSANMGIDEEDYGITSSASDRAASIVEKTAFLPDYAFADNSESPVGTSVSGVLGSVMVALVAGIVCLGGGAYRRKVEKQ